MKQKTVGILLLALIIAGAIGYKAFEMNQTPQRILTGLIGGEKIGLVEDPDVVRILKEKYAIELDYTKAGSMEMVEGDTSSQDFLFPSSQTALELFKENSAGLLKSEILFSSPMVFYSWDFVTDALMSQGIVQVMDDTYYVTDMPKLIDAMIRNRKWSDFGLDQLYGSVAIVTTDPTKSNSGNMFSGLMANMLNNGEIVDEITVQNVLPDLKKCFDKLGYMQSSSGNLFEEYLRMGAGQCPIIAGYESQMIEFAVQNPQVWKDNKSSIRILYPIPTVWSAHPYMALTENGIHGITAMMDPEIQRITWEKHGFRTGTSLNVNTSLFNIEGLPQKINKVISMPKPSVMKTMMDALAQ